MLTETQERQIKRLVGVVGRTALGLAKNVFYGASGDLAAVTVDQRDAVRAYCTRNNISLRDAQNGVTPGARQLDRQLMAIAAVALKEEKANARKHKKLGRRKPQPKKKPRMLKIAA
jgi:hypothetical protein